MLMAMCMAVEEEAAMAEPPAQVATMVFLGKAILVRIAWGVAGRP